MITGRLGTKDGSKTPTRKMHLPCCAEYSARYFTVYIWPRHAKALCCATQDGYSQACSHSTIFPSHALVGRIKGYAIFQLFGKVLRGLKIAFWKFADSNFNGVTLWCIEKSVRDKTLWCVRYVCVRTRLRFSDREIIRGLHIRTYAAGMLQVPQTYLLPAYNQRIFSLQTISILRLR